MSTPQKCVLILDDRLPAGLLANTAAILGITLGQRLPEIVGPDPADQAGNRHAGIVQFLVPVLRGTPETLRQLREALSAPAYDGLTVVDFTDLAQRCKTYDEFLENMAACPPEALSYLGLALCGDRRTVNHLTGNLPLLR